MKYYMAPLEGITGYIYRNMYQKYFHNIDKYFAPFIAPGKDRKLNAKDLKDILPENNQNINLVPQILTNHSQAFINMCDSLENMGYKEVNLNLGCPSGTVVSKNKGAGMLKDTDQLNYFLEDIFNGFKNENKDGLKISVKTRIGFYSTDEFLEINQIFNQYPISELIIHPRIQQEFYKNTPHYDIFAQAVQQSKHKLCYNGDIFTCGDGAQIIKQFSSIDCMMIGRGIIANPGLVGELQGAEKISRRELKDFLMELCEAYSAVMSGERNVLFRMKEIWFYVMWQFPDQAKQYKKIKKAQTLREYNDIVNQLL